MDHHKFCTKNSDAMVDYTRGTKCHGMHPYLTYRRTTSDCLGDRSISGYLYPTIYRLVTLTQQHAGSHVMDVVAWINWIEPITETHCFQNDTRTCLVTSSPYMLFTLWIHVPDLRWYWPSYHLPIFTIIISDICCTNPIVACDEQ